MKRMATPRGDEFEATQMSDGAAVVHRGKVVSRGMAAMLAVPGLFVMGLAVYVAIINETSQKPLPAAALPFVVAAMILFGLMFLGMSLVFAVVRTVVTEQAVHVKYGLWGPTIPLSSIRSVGVVDYDWTQFGGWGIRLGKDGTWAYVPRGGRVLELRYEEDGRDKRILVSVENAEETARQIERARAATGVRVAPDRLRIEGAAGADTAEAQDEEAEEVARENVGKRA
jgi:hypothetical protein